MAQDLMGQDLVAQDLAEAATARVPWTLAEWVQGLDQNGLGAPEEQAAARLSLHETGWTASRCCGCTGVSEDGPTCIASCRRAWPHAAASIDTRVAGTTLANRKNNKGRESP
ncbi:hypothetical protein GCM10007857_22070 [Bradyrhizobium iriomotense]|uniref:Uncharacterized protein n=1 Tax=Bradyrhizobium iriomotense TaxID=441950 RepID=A0ABQ6AVB9_9BRAD|nr:hypothetical protein GCM10007857_22070 [Bradyrhizobium iriomotense]